MKSVLWLRLEALAMLAGAILFVWIHPDVLPVWLVVLILIAPDFAMAGYAFGQRLGAVCYNVVHTYAAPIMFVVIWHMVNQFDSRGVEIAAFWVIHIAADRLLGYGLKEPTGFKDTHLGRVGRS